jgi:hypothetical protein
MTWSKEVSTVFPSFSMIPKQCSYMFLHLDMWAAFHILSLSWRTLCPTFCSLFHPTKHLSPDLSFLNLFAAVRLGDQCFYRQTCAFTDQHATCIQINHNAICQCKPGYHTVALQRPTKKVFCSEGMDLVHVSVSGRGINRRIGNIT